MKNFLTSFLGCLCALILWDFIKSIEPTQIPQDDMIAVDTIQLDTIADSTTAKLPDTIPLAVLPVKKVPRKVVSKKVKHSNPVTWTERDKKYLVKYCKTQIYSTIDADWWGVVQTIVNRCNRHQCSMTTYWFTPKINHSKTLKLIHAGKLKHKSFMYSYRPSDKRDSIRMDIVERVLAGNIPDSLYLPPYVVAFESHPVSWNLNKPRNIFDRRYIYTKFKHEYYYDPEYKTQFDGKETKKATSLLSEK